jgi:hypothetical protein
LNPSLSQQGHVQRKMRPCYSDPMLLNESVTPQHSSNHASTGSAGDVPCKNYVVQIDKRTTEPYVTRTGNSNSKHDIMWTNQNCLKVR